MRRGLSWIVLAVGLALFVGATESWAADAQYVGAKKCKSCHKKELIGNQYAAWVDGPHAKAFETLKSEDAAKVAKEKGISGPAYEADECLKCHMTGHGEPATAFKKKPLAAKDGVQCESCHGPGSLYRKKKTMSDHDKSVAAGMWEPGEDEKICQKCHNKDATGWDPEEGFNFEERKEEIAHNIPEDVKGKYLEIVKKRKAEGGGDDDDEEEDDD